MWNILKHILQSRTDNSPIDESIDSDTFNDFFSEIGMKLTTNFGQLRLPKCDVMGQNQSHVAKHKMAEFCFFSENVKVCPSFVFIKTKYLCKFLSIKLIFALFC